MPSRCAASVIDIVLCCILVIPSSSEGKEREKGQRFAVTVGNLEPSATAYRVGRSTLVGWLV